MRLRIGILGTRGIPNHYGGFEQFAACLSKELAERGHEITVYNSHKHPYQQNHWNNVRIVHCFDPEYLLGTAGQFLYDLNCIMDARRRTFDILLVLGYTSSSVWGKLFPRNSVIITNMDGLEWKRTKYSKWVQRFLLYAEKLAVRFTDYCIADSVAIQKYLQHKYGVEPKYISYGAEIMTEECTDILLRYKLDRYRYFIVMARMEPENNMETILDGVGMVNDERKIMVIGNTANAYGLKLVKKFASNPNILFVGTIYDEQVLHTLKKYCLLYFHGHSVGGTNPSLLEAMSSGALICAHNNPFNRAVLGNNAFYFSDAKDVGEIADSVRINATTNEMIGANLQKIKDAHSWKIIASEYENYFIQCYQSKQ